MSIQSILGLLGVGIALGLAAVQAAKAAEQRKKKVPVKIPSRRKERR